MEEKERELFDLDKLPEWLRESTTLISYRSPRTPLSAIAIMVVAVAAQVVGIKRLRVHVDDDDPVDVLINIFVLVFMGSGTGKDRTLRRIKELLFREQLAYFKSIIEAHNESRIEEVKEKAKSKLTTSTARDKYIVRNAPRKLFTEIGEVTYEGVLSARAEFSKMQKGALNITISEFAYYLKADPESIRGKAMVAVNDMYDFGSDKGKLIKSQQTIDPVEGVPVNFIGLAALSIFSNTSESENFNVSAGRQSARRYVVCFPDDDEFFKRARSLDEIKQDKERRAAAKERMLTCVSELKERFDNWKDEQIIQPTEKATDILCLYAEKCQEEAGQLNPITQESYIAEVANRAWKAWKMAGVLSAFKPKETKISAQTANEAIYLIEFYSGFLKKTLTLGNESPSEKLYKFLKTKPGVAYSKTTLREQMFVPNKSFGQWIKEQDEFLHERAAIDRLLFVKEPGYKSLVEYKIKRLTDP